MLNNPFAPVFRQALYSDVLKNALYIDKGTFEHTDRVHVFMNEFNHFLKSAGERPVLYQHYDLDEEKLLEFALFLRGYMRDAQQVLNVLTPEFSHDADLAELFKASSKYAVACNQLPHNKKIFKENTDYRFWKMDCGGDAKHASFEDGSEKLNTSRHNLLLFMPFRIKDDVHEVRKWVSNNMQTVLNDTTVYGKQVDTYVAHFPIQKSRGEGIYSLMNTIRYPDTYYEDSDMRFAKKNLSMLLGKNLQFDEQNHIVSGEKLTNEELNRNFANLSVFAYCSGMANIHRCFNALYDLGQQIYDADQLKTAMANIYVISYGFLPVQQNSLYSGAHFFANRAQDTMQKEPFAKMNNPTLYEQTRYANHHFPARLSVMNDGKNYVVSVENKKTKTIITDNEIKVFNDKEYGHNLLNINTPDILDSDNFVYNLFCNVLKNASVGIRGKKVFDFTQHVNPNVTLMGAAMYANRQLLGGNCC